MTKTMPVLDIRNLDVAYATDTGLSPAVSDFSLSLAPGEFMGLAGESGCGKSTVAQSILRLLRAPGIITGGQILIEGADILAMDDAQVRALRWDVASIVLQNALTALNPVHRIGRQLQEVLDRSVGEKARSNPAELLEMVGIDPKRVNAFPHELSGGMRQRVVIAMALALKPKLVILDEPTTALDVIVQRDIFETVKALQAKLGFAVLLITHDLPLLFELADRIAVMQAGRIVEMAPMAQFRAGQQHAYSRQLVNATPRLDSLPATARLALPTGGTPILDIAGLRKSFRDFQAIDGVSLSVQPQEIVAVVGESGSGKSTLGRIVTGLASPSDGQVLVDGAHQVPVSRRRRHDPRPAQMVFQDVYGSLNPLHTIEHHLRRAVAGSGKFARSEVSARVRELLDLVGLTPIDTFLPRRPHELSGGQRQRVGLARALASRPRLLVADEPISMLDVSIRLDVLNLIARLRREEGVAVLYITHDIVSAGYLADRIVVMLAGRIVEEGASHALIAAPSHDYTRQLLAAVPGGATLLHSAPTSELS